MDPALDLHLRFGPQNSLARVASSRRREEKREREREREREGRAEVKPKPDEGLLGGYSETTIKSNPNRSPILTALDMYLHGAKAKGAVGTVGVTTPTPTPTPTPPQLRGGRGRYPRPVLLSSSSSSSSSSMSVSVSSKSVSAGTHKKYRRGVLVARGKSVVVSCINNNGVDQQSISDQIKQVEAENAKLKDKIDRVKTKRQTSPAAAAAAPGARKQGAGAAGSSQVKTTKGVKSKGARGAKAQGNKLSKEDIENELAQIEQLRLENEKLRQLAEERLRELTGESEIRLDESPPSTVASEASAEQNDDEELQEEEEEETEVSEPELEAIQEDVVEIEEEEVVSAAAVVEEVVEKAPVVEEEVREEKLDLDSHNAAEVIKDKAHWLYFTIPDKPRAGEDAIIYFNRMSSTVLRDRPSIKMILSFNGWALASNPYQLAPSPTPKDKYNDWWSTKIHIAEDAYEMNFVFHDDDGNFDNNGGQDYVNAVTGDMTMAKWQDSAELREAKLEEDRKRKEEEDLERAERQRIAELEAEDRNQALALVNEARSNIGSLQGGASTNILRGGEIAVATKPASIVAGKECVFIYNATGGPLEGSSQIKLQIGYNGWKASTAIEMKKQSTFDNGNNVWYTDFEVSPEAVALNAVLFNENNTYDNNSSNDFNLLVDVPGNDNAYWDEVAAKLQEKFKQKRIADEAKEQERHRRRATRKQKAKDYSMEVARRKLSHILYTEPSEIVAGEAVKVFYNTDNTVLKGKADSTFLNYSFNRWAHSGTFSPVKMQKSAGSSGWVSAEIDVPEDAYMVDFVCGDSEHGGGTFDNNHGLDYHLSISKGPKSPPLYICHIAVEMAPIAKVGGLGDVVTALSRAVQEHGHHAEIILPRYDFLLASPLLQGTTYETEMNWGGCKNFVTTCIVEGVRVFFIEPSNGMFKVPSVYSTQNEDNAKFDYFCKCALEFLLQTGRQPDIIHCHDWSSASAARAYWEDYHHYGLWKPKVVFTIHNLEFGAAKIGEAAMHSQKFTTVSPSYAYEVGDHPAVNPHLEKFSGIINGIDTDIWDPMDDQFLPLNYEFENAIEGKAAARDALRDKLNLRKDRDCPVIGVVSRLTSQKGIHLIKHAAYRTLDRGGQFVLLGSAPDPKIQADFNDLASQLGGDMGAFCYAYDEPLSHLIYAGCDMILVPSMFEPCGLTQMIAMRYGSVPVVRQTGGLRDTVFDVEHDQERAAWEIHGSDDYKKEGMDGTNGFSFEGTDEGSLDYALNRAIDCWYNDREFFHKLQKRVMEQDWSWNKPALDYIELYYSAIKS